MISISCLQKKHKNKTSWQSDHFVHFERHNHKFPFIIVTQILQKCTCATSTEMHVRYQVKTILKKSGNYVTINQNSLILNPVLQSPVVRQNMSTETGG